MQKKQLNHRRKIMQKEITIRPYEQEDIDFIHRLVNNRNIMSYWFEEAYQSRASLEESFQKGKDRSDVRSFIITDGDVNIGLVQLLFIDFIHRKAEFAIMIDPEQQGNGYAKGATEQAIDYAFRVLNLHKLYLLVDETNEKAIHIYKKCGFSVDAVLHEEFFVNGTYRNAVIMNMFQRDYLPSN